MVSKEVYKLEGMVSKNIYKHVRKSQTQNNI